MTNTMLDVVTDARIDTGTGIVRDTTTNVMTDTGIDVVMGTVVGTMTDTMPDAVITRIDVVTKGMTDVRIDM